MKCKPASAAQQEQQHPPGSSTCEALASIGPAQQRASRWQPAEVGLCCMQFRGAAPRRPAHQHTYTQQLELALASSHLLLCECVQGVSQVSQMVQYPADPSIDTPPVWVAHFAHPIEVEWVARAVPAPKDWPRLLLQVGLSTPSKCSSCFLACVGAVYMLAVHVCAADTGLHAVCFVEGCSAQLPTAYACREQGVLSEGAVTH